MRVLFVTPECAPLTKTGGLGDVSAALPAALRAQAIDVCVLVPAYGAVPAQAKLLATLHALGHEVRLLHAGEHLLVDCPVLYARPGGPYQDASGADWSDNALRFGVLSRVAALLGAPDSPFDWKPEVVHCNDWPTALAPVYLHAVHRRPATLMTVHNLAFQGLFPAQMLGELELPSAAFSIEGLEFYGHLSFLKGGLMYADAITTVSPTYAREIQTEEYGCGLEGVLAKRRDDLRGILNGIDDAAWDPLRDPHIAERYSAVTLDRKRANKRALQSRVGLPEAPEVPLLGVVCRFTHQKGVDLIAAAAEALVGVPAQLCLLGTGERDYERALTALAARHPQSIAVVVGFSEALAHLIEAGADIFLMPSRFEPCGLNQLYSQRYGTPPVARATGGLADTIVDGETGFLFQQADSAALAAAVGRAIEAWREPRRWREIQRRAMARDFSWSEPARRYADLYARLARARSP